MTLQAVFAVLAQAAAQNPLNIPMPTSEEIMACVPVAYRQAGSMEEVPPAQRLAIVACSQALVSRHINAGAPYVIDAITTLQSTSASAARLQYNYRVDVDAGQVTADNRANIERSTRANVCANADMVRTMVNGGSYRYVWTDRSGRLIHQILIERCP